MIIPPFVWLCVICSGFFLAVYMAGLAGAYRTGDMSVAYPLARALPVLFITAITLLLGLGTPVGCGFVVHASNGQVINIEGDSEHPINEGTACSKGSSLYQMANNENRLTTVRYRAPYATEWEDLTWDEAIPMIAQRI